MVTGILVLFFFSAMVSSLYGQETDSNGHISVPDAQKRTGKPPPWNRLGKMHLHLVAVHNPDTAIFFEAWVGGSITGTICGAPDWKVVSIDIDIWNAQAHIIGSYDGYENCSPTVWLTFDLNTGEGEYYWHSGESYSVKVSEFPFRSEK